MQKNEDKIVQTITHLEFLNSKVFKFTIKILLSQELFCMYYMLYEYIWNCCTKINASISKILFVFH